jgi:endonuclease/exonuclease/phosphatase family metal-dependent hydrolase
VSHLRLRLAIVVGALLALAGSTSGLAASDGVVISQVYGAGGNAGATYNADFIELFNRGTTPVVLDGMSVQYASATGTGALGANAGQLTELSGTIQPGKYLLIHESSGATGAPLPANDIVDSTLIAMAAGAGKVALATGTASLGCNTAATCTTAGTLGRIVDLVGYGNATFFEGTAAAPTLSATSSAVRAGSGCTDTDDNAADFAALSPPAPRNSATTAFVCGGTPTPTPPTGVGAATPASVLAGGSTLLTVTVTPGANPTSSDITVMADLSPIGGSDTQFFFDDGTNGDAVAGNNVFSYSTTVAPGTTPGAKSLPVLITDAEERTAGAPIALTVAEPPAAAIEISEIQGAAHISPHNGDRVTTTGIVIGKIGSSFYIQDPTPDANPDTSEGLQVFGSAATAGVSVGDEVSVLGTVSEFRSGLTSLTLTELTNPVVTVLSTGNALPAPTVIGTGGRIPPNTVIEDDATGNVEAPGVLFDPAEDGLDFYESLEGMLVQMNDLVATSFTFTNFGEIFVVGDNGANATTMTPRGGIVISPGDLNPERMVIDDEWFKTGPPAMPAVNVGGTFPGPHVGIMDWAFGEYRIQLRSQPVVGSTGVSVRESAVAAGTDKVSIATFNVENLAGNEPDAKYNTLAGMIVNNLAAPDIVSLEEIQDNTGATNDSVVDANVTLDRLVAAIAAAGGPAYSYRQINPVDDQDGGQPGGNIRVGFIFRTDRGLAFIDRPGGDSTTPVAVVAGPNGPELSASPGRVAPGDPAWNASRKPLAAEFTYHGHKLFVITNHFNSKGGDQGLFGPQQPPVLSSEVQRNQQATLLASFVGDILAADPNANIAVVGDLNDFQFSPPLQKLKDAGLTALIETLPPAERYSYVFDGNSQALDHIMVSSNLLNHGAAAAGYDIVHVNSEFIDQASDHDPQLVQLTMPAPTISASASPAANAAGWNNTPVTVSFTCVDPLSAIVGGCPAPVTLGTEGADQSVSRTVTTEGGLSLSAGVANIDIDLTNPTVTYTGGKASYQVDEQVSITCTAADTLSGIASTTCANVSGPAYSFGVGSHTFSATATDRAGNSGSGSVTFTVGVTYTSLCNLSQRFADSRAVGTALCALLRLAEVADANHSHLIKRLSLQAYVLLVRAQTGRTLTAAEAATLISLSQRL